MAMAIDRIIQDIFLVTYPPSFGFVANQAESRGKTEITKRIGDGADIMDGHGLSEPTHEMMTGQEDPAGEGRVV